MRLRITVDNAKSNVDWKGGEMTENTSKCAYCGHAAHPRGQKCGVPNPVKPCKCKAGASFWDSIGKAIGESLFGGGR